MKSAVIWGALGVLVVALATAMGPDLVRYMKIRSM
jgi:hypothetical protein